MARVNTTIAPNLPMMRRDYDPNQIEQVHNALRLYFNQIDNFSRTLGGPLGSAFLNTPHIAASDNTDQFATGDNIPTLVIWSSADSNAGFTLNINNSATAPLSGVYKIDYSLQLVNTDNVSHDVFVWLQVNGGDLANSASKFTIPARKSASEFGFVIAYSSVTFPAQGGDEVRLWWATDKAATSGGVAGVFIDYIAPQTTPYVRPASPSAIGSIVFVSCPCDVSP
jgi:hypothetical protein